MKKRNPSCLFVGEAPGYRGCLLSGIPFTDEYTLVYNRFFYQLNSSIKVKIEMDNTIKPQTETSSRVVWDCLDQLPEKTIPLMWNIYPFHPSTVENTNTNRPNRTPNKAECELGKIILKRLLSCFEIKQLYAIGRTSEQILKKEYSDIVYLRHPARGGSSTFKQMFSDIYKT